MSIFRGEFMSFIAATLGFVLKRAWHRRAILLPVVLGMVGVVTLLAGMPLFSKAANDAALQSTLHTPGPALSRNLAVQVGGPPLNVSQYQWVGRIINDTLQADLGNDLRQTPPIRTGEANGGYLYADGDAGMPLDTTNLWFSSNMDSAHLRLTAGRFPSAKLLGTTSTSQALGYDVEAMISPDWANQFHLKLNDVLDVTDEGRHTNDFLRLHIVGFFQPKNLADPAWFDSLDPFTEPVAFGPDALPAAPIWLNEGVFENVFPQLKLFATAQYPCSYFWSYYLNLDSLSTDNAAAIANGIQTLKLRFHLPDDLFTPPTLVGQIEPPPPLPHQETVLSGLDKTLQDFLSQYFFNTVITLVAVLPGLAILLVYLLMAAGALVEQSREELALMQSRGASQWQMLALFVNEAILLCVAALVVGPLFAGQLTNLLAWSTLFGNHSGHVDLGLAFPPLQSYLYAGLAAILCFLAALAPAVRIMRSNLAVVRRETSRPRLRSLMLRLLPAILLTALGVYGALHIQQRGAFFLQNIQGNVSVDWVAAAAPTFLLLGVTSLGLLLLPPLLTALDRLGQRLSGISAGLALRQLARRPLPYSRLVLLLSLTISLGFFAALFNGSLASSYTDRAGFTAGADLRLVEGDDNLPDFERQAAPLADHLHLLSGVTDGMSAYRVAGLLPSAPFNSSSQVSLLAVESARYAQVGYWRDDFADQPLSTLMGLLQQPSARQEAIPALVSDRLLADLSVQIGSVVAVAFGSGSTEFVIVGTYHYFPTLDPGGDTVVCDLSRLLALLNAAHTYQFMPNEVWLKLAPNAPTYTADQAQEQLLLNPQHQDVRVLQAYDRATIAAALQNDPFHFVIAGTLSLDFIIAALLCIVGFVFLFYLIARQRVFEFGVLRAMGISLRQVSRSLGWEQGILLLSALLVGIPLGVLVAGIALPALAFDQSGQPLLPPIVLHVSLPGVLQQSLFLLACALAAVALTIVIFRRLRVQEVLRLGEE